MMLVFWMCLLKSLVSHLYVYIIFQRDDTEVLDEPLYAHYLRVTGADRPYREELLSKMVSKYHYLWTIRVILQLQEVKCPSYFPQSLFGIKCYLLGWIKRRQNIDMTNVLLLKTKLIVYVLMIFFVKCIGV